MLQLINKIKEVDITNVKYVNKLKSTARLNAE